MARLRLADVLTDFGADTARMEPVPLAIVADPEPLPRPMPAAIDPAPLIAAAVREAEEALALRLADQHAADTAALRAGHAAELEAAGQRLGIETAQALTRALAEIEQRAITVATGSVARLIAPMLSAEIQRRSVDGLAGAMQGALTVGESIRLRMSGPKPVLDGLASALGDRISEAEIVLTNGVDLAAELDDTIYETRLAEWAGGLAEALR